MEYLTYNPREPVKESLWLRFRRLNEKEADVDYRGDHITWMNLPF